jgi:hypothetical protein
MLAFVLMVPALSMAADDEPKSLARVRKELDRLKATWGQVEPITDEALKDRFPDYDFYSVIFRQYPVGRRVPPPLRPANVFAVPQGDGKPQILTDVKSLEKFFKTACKPARDQSHAQNAVRAWLALSTALHHDGFYRFALSPESVKAWSEGASIKCSGRAIAMQGGNGQIGVTLDFDDSGKLSTATESARIRSGPRPICQATKLLDPDPIVRRMAEQDLRVMGVAVKPYLDEERAQANPELRQAIDRLWQEIERDKD